MQFSHLDTTGKARMVDVSNKPIVRRTAVAGGEITLNPKTIKAISDKELPKGDVLTVAKIAGIQAAKQTSSIIPLCHQIVIDEVDIAFSLQRDHIKITATVRCSGRTGVEMEALSAVSGAALGLYDMCKAVDKEMVIGPIALIEKRKEQLL